MGLVQPPCLPLLVAAACTLAARACASLPLPIRTDTLSAPSPFRPSFVSNMAFRTTTSGDIVGAQDGNVVNVRGPDGAFYLAAILYGDCPFTACANESMGACGFGPGSVRVWASPDLSQVRLGPYLACLNWVSCNGCIPNPWDADATLCARALAKMFCA